MDTHVHFSTGPALIVALLPARQITHFVAAIDIDTYIDIYTQNFAAD